MNIITWCVTTMRSRYRHVSSADYALLQRVMYNLIPPGSTLQLPTCVCLSVCAESAAAASICGWTRLRCCLLSEGQWITTGLHQASPRSLLYVMRPETAVGSVYVPFLSSVVGQSVISSSRRPNGGTTCWEGKSRCCERELGIWWRAFDDEASAARSGISCRKGFADA